MKFKTKLLAAAGAMLLAGAASAQAYNWNGYYAGFNLGSQKGKADMNTSFDPNTSDYFYSGNLPIIAGATTASPSNTRFHAGALFGYNSVSGGQLLGYEMDLNFMELRFKNMSGASYICIECESEEGFSVDQRVRADKLATLRGRWGMLSGNGLFYVTGGVAWTKLRMSSSFVDSYGATASTSVKKGKAGWVLGAGYEQPMSNGWTFKAEYLRADFGTLTSSSQNLTVYEGAWEDRMQARVDLKVDILRVGFNKKF